MGRFERSIKIAFDKLSGEILDADEVFDKTKDAFQIRKQYHEGNLLLSCCECEQDLMVSTSKFDRLYFKHKPGHDYCILSDGKLSPDEQEKFTKILKNKESERHKELKNKIGKLLRNVDGVDNSSIAIDDRFIIRGTEKRKPDVYCKYQNKELVFEIQLSDLSLGYILSRYEFYKKHGMYLIWILDNFDIHNQGTLERDIKYLTKYENFFKLDESSDSFHLECEYKFPFLTDKNTLLTKWLTKLVNLSQIKFDSNSFQIYYYNFGDNKEIAERKQEEKAREIEAEEKKKIEEERKISANRKATEVTDTIKELRKRKSQNFDSAKFLIEQLDNYELDRLNTVLSLTKRSKDDQPAILHWISSAENSDVSFIEFILTCNSIELDINVKGKNEKTAFQLVYENEKIYNYIPLKSIFKRGYRLTDTDKEYFQKLENIKNDRRFDIYLYELCDRLTNRDLVDFVFDNTKLLFIIDSARQHEIIGFNYKPNEWIAFANNAIQYHSEYWEYIEMAFKGYGLWETLTKSDRKGTFEKKVQKFYANIPDQKYDIDDVFKDLYSDLHL